MKTILEWLKQLPYGYCERALIIIADPDTKVKCMSTAIKVGILIHQNLRFVDYDFWEEVYKYYLEQENPPKPRELPKL